MLPERFVEGYDCRVKILHVEAGRKMLGGANQVRALVRGLRERGVENVLVCPPGDVAGMQIRGLRFSAGFAGQGESAWVRPRHDGTIVLPMGGDLDIGLARRLRAVFRSVRPDIVHVHSRRGADLYAGLACLAEGLPAVLTRRVDSPEPSFWARFKYRPYRAIVAISRAVEAQLTGGAGLDRTRVRRIPSAVNPHEFLPDRTARARLLAEFALPEDAFVAAVSAQLIKRKGHDVLLACLPQLVQRYPELRVVCFGEGSLKRRLRRRIGALGLGSLFQLAGFRRDLPSLLPGVDVLVHPARREGLGVALLEAMSSGVPVVASTAGGIVDVVEPEVEGLLVPPDNPAELGAALERIIGDASLRKRMGIAGRARVQREFSVELMAKRYLDLYREILMDTETNRRGVEVLS